VRRFAAQPGSTGDVTCKRQAGLLDIHVCHELVNGWLTESRNGMDPRGETERCGEGRGGDRVATLQGRGLLIGLSGGSYPERPGGPAVGVRRLYITALYLAAKSVV
jgi:hypothetical protein